MENVGCRHRFDDVHALPLRAMQRSPHGPFELRLGPEVSAMFDSDSADYEHNFTQWPPGGCCVEVLFPKTSYFGNNVFLSD